MNDLRSKLEAVQVGGCVTTAQLAHALDKRSKNLARSGRDWCQARGIKYKPDGKTNWVRVKDVLDHIEKLFHDKQPSNDRTPRCGLRNSKTHRLNMGRKRTGSIRVRGGRWYARFTLRSGKEWEHPIDPPADKTPYDEAYARDVVKGLRDPYAPKPTPDELRATKERMDAEMREHEKGIPERRTQVEAWRRGEFKMPWQKCNRSEVRP